MLLAAGFIAASAFTQNHGGWSQVCTTEQAQRGQSALNRSILPLAKGKQKTTYERQVPRSRIKMNEQDMGEGKLS